MNEVLAVLYCCFLENYGFSPNCIIPKKYHESDLFFTFSNLMVYMRDSFLREMDHSRNGIQGRIRTFSQIMKVMEPHAFNTIE